MSVEQKLPRSHSVEEACTLVVVGDGPRLHGYILPGFARSLIYKLDVQVP